MREHGVACTSGLRSRLAGLMVVGAALMPVRDTAWAQVPAPGGAPVTTLVPGEVRVCLFSTFPPFDAKDEKGAWWGWDVDFISAFAATLNLRFVPVEVASYDGFWLEPGRNQCDIAASGIADLASRRAQTGTLGGWSVHYYAVARAFGIRPGTKLDGIGDLAGHTVMVVKGSTADVDVRSRAAQAGITNIIVAGTSDDVSNARRVAENRPGAEAYAFGSGLGTVQYLSRQFGLEVAWPHCLMMPDGQLQPEPFSYVVRTASTGLLDALNAYIKDPAHAYPGGAGPDCPAGR